MGTKYHQIYVWDVAINPIVIGEDQLSLGRKLNFNTLWEVTSDIVVRSVTLQTNVTSILYGMQS